MKKSLKKVIMTSTIMTSSLVSIGSIVGLNYITNNGSIESNQDSLQKQYSTSHSIKFEGKDYNTIEDAIAAYEKTNVSIDKYIGDIYKESSAGYDYRKIYLGEKEVQKYDISKIKSVYSTSYGTLTENIEESKKSFVEQPILAYKDKNGNIHYTEKDANSSNIKDVQFNSIAYYEIDDYSNLNSSGEPKKVKINPLNKTDIDELKKIALVNTKNEKSGFSIQYYYVVEEYWNKNDKKYQAPKNPGDHISLDKNLSTSKDHVIYTIDYNGVPLYKFNHKWISDNFFVNKRYDIIEKEFVGGNLIERMSKDPAKYITNFISSTLAQNEGAMSSFLSNLENVSNNLKYDKDGVFLVKKYGQPFNSSEKTINFVSKEIKNNTEEFKNKFLDDTKFKNFNINEDQVNIELKANKNDSSSLLNSNTGTFKAIREYNKSLEKYLNGEVSEQLSKNIKNNMVNNLNDIVLLFSNKTLPMTIKYGEYVNSNIYFNDNLLKNNISMIESLEEKNEFIKNASTNSTEVVWLVYDRRGTFLSSSSNRQLALENATNIAKPQLNEDYVYYNKDGKNIKIKNEITELNILNLNGRSFGFVTYEELYNCLYEYIRMTSEPEKPPVQETLPFQPSNISVTNISNILSSFTSLEEVNNLSVEQKFSKFGSEFNITSIESWNKFIGNGLTFVDKEKTRLSASIKNDNSLSEMKTATMTVQLQNGNTFSNGESSFSTDVEYSPNIGVLPEDNINGKQTYSSTQDIVVTLSIIIGVLLIAEIIVLTLTIINKRKRSNDELKVLRKYYANNK